MLKIVKRVSFLLLITILMTSCLSLKITVEEENYKEGLFDQKYGELKRMYQVFNKDDLKYYKINTRRAIINSSVHTEEEIKQAISEIEGLEYEEGKYISFTMYGNEPAWKNQLPKKISIINSRGGDVPLKISNHNVTYTYNGVPSGRRYVYLIILDKPFSKDSVKEEGPLYMITDFEDGNYIKCIIK